MSKPSLFIGSSSESKHVGKQISKNNTRYVKTTMWDEGVFRPGEQYMHSLRRQLLLSDFALLIIYPDDKLVKRKKSGYVTRDNVILELGLFMGALDLHRGFYLVVTVLKKGKSITPDIPSDLKGLTRFDLTVIDKKDKISEQKNNESIKDLCVKLKNIIQDNKEILGVDLLPSTPLAIGYFNNLIFQVCEKMSKTKHIRVNNKKYDLSDQKFQFFIVIPNNANASHAGFSKFVTKYRLVDIPIENLSKSRKFSIKGKINPKNQKIVFYDYATTLLSAIEAVDLATPPKTPLRELKMIKDREIANFEKTLHHLLDSPNAAGFNDNVSIISINELKKMKKYF